MNAPTDRSEQRNPWRAIRFIALALVVCAFAGGCSSFDRDFKKAMVASELPTNDDMILGAWSGEWVSDHNGHNGALRCIVEPILNDVGQPVADRYEARFHAVYAKILKFEYTIELNTQRQGAVLHFDSEQDIGWLAGGVYQYEGTITLTGGDDPDAPPGRWESTYKSKHDHGRFMMNRMKAESGEPKAEQ